MDQDLFSDEEEQPAAPPMYNPLDDVPMSMRRAREPSARERSRSPTRALDALATFRGRVLSQKMVEKLKEKEIAYRDIPAKDMPLYRAAAALQWKEWLEFDSVDVLSLAASQAAKLEYDRSRFLPSRFVYRDKNAHVRPPDNPVPIRAKARLCCGGHRDPDHQMG